MGVILQAAQSVYNVLLDKVEIVGSGVMSILRALGA